MDKLSEDSNYQTARFSCDCHDSRHIMDISIEVNKRILIYMAFSEGFVSHGFWDKLKATFRLLRKGKVIESEFILREEDIPNLVNLLNEQLILKGD